MTGRGIDQVLPHPADPRIHEPYVRDARRYVQLAERENGAIPMPVDFPYVWGDALAVLDREAPRVRIVNLETSVTTSDDYWRGKGINYRMHPANCPVLTAAAIDVAVLANNHVLDWGYGGLAETLLTLHAAGIRTAGAGADLGEAAAPAVVALPGGGRLLVFSFGVVSSGVPDSWGATGTRAGVNLLSDLSEQTVRRLTEEMSRARRPGDMVVASIHWGGNWGYGITRPEREFAHRLVADAGVDVVHGHSSHHVKGVEVHRGRPIFYGCGDLINDYEGIGGYGELRGDLSLLYFVRFDPASGRLDGVRMVPMQMRRFRLHRASAADTRWLADTLSREGKRLGTRVETAADGSLLLRW
jgi:poly-gamma-glutamate synthesis protein (capsule biosynthesis protein)